MSFEYQMLALMTLLFLLAWIPSSLAKFQTFGWSWIASNRHPVVEKELSYWGGRVERAYSNLKDYFPAYAIAIILLGLTSKFNECTQWAAGLYVGARVVHFASYGFGNVLLRTISFTVGIFANLYLLIQIFI